MDLLHAAPFQGVIPRPYLKGTLTHSSLLLEPPKEKMLSTLGARSFYAAAPCLWNSLPAELRDIQSLCSFKQKLKTHLFRAG